MIERANGRRNGFLASLIFLTLGLSACGDGSTPDVPGTEAAQVATVDPAQTTVPGNSPPTIAGAPGTDVNATAMYVFQPSAADADGDSLTFSAQGLPEWATLDAGTGRISGTPPAEDAGESAEILLTVSDGKEMTSLPAFKIIIKESATAAISTSGSAEPQISGSATTTATAGKAWSFTPTASDADTLTLTFSITNKPTWANFSSVTGKLSGTPGAKNVGTVQNIVISVSDGLKTASLPAFSVLVKAAPNNAPVISGSPSGTATVGSGYSFTPTASDADKQTLGFSIANKPSWATFSTATGALTGVPGAGNVGTFANIVITVSDGVAKTALASFSIGVKAAANGAPTISGQASTSATIGAPYEFRPTAKDPNGDALSFAITAKPAWASFNATTGALTGVPGTSSQGSFNNVVISVSDGKSSTALPAFNILVSASTLGAATLSWNPPTQNTDGSELTNLGGYRIYYGTDADALSSSIQVTNPGLTSYTVGNLSAGKYYFALAAYTTDGAESELSAVGSKTIM